MCNNPNLHVDLVDTNAYYKFGKIYQFILKLWRTDRRNDGRTYL